MSRGLVALCALALGIASATGAQAGVVQLAAPSDLAATDTTLTFPNTTFGAAFSSPASYTAGGDTLTFADTGGTFEIDQAGTNYTGTAFANGTNILYAAGFNGPNAPITLTFSTPVSEFGTTAEEFAVGPYTISFSAYDGASLLGSFTAAGCDPSGTCSPSSGTLSFEGLRATGGSVITSIVFSDANGNNIGLGPQVFAPATSVPEPASLALFGSALVAFGIIRRRRGAV